MTDIPPPAANPVDTLDPEALTLLFDRDPATLPPVDLDALLAELRRRADAFKAEAAAAAAAPKASRAKSPKGRAIDAALAALSDTPVAELSLDALEKATGKQA